jgi:hypothetical protein
MVDRYVYQCLVILRLGIMDLPQALENFNSRISFFRRKVKR